MRHDQIRQDCYRQAWITYAEAAHISGFSIGHIYNLANKCHLHTRPRGAYRVDRLSLEQYLNGDNQTTRRAG